MSTETTTSQTHDAPLAGDPGARGQILHIRHNGTYRLIGHGPEPLGLDVMQSLVGGFIERVCTPQFDLWVNEEGLLRDDFDPNVGASWLLAKHGAPGYTIVGPAFVAANNGEEAVPARPDVIAAAVALLQSLGYEEDPELRPIAGGSGDYRPYAACAPIAEYFKQLDPGAIDQGQGRHYPGDRFEPCCVGAHLAFFLNAELVRAQHEEDSYRRFLEGEEALAELLELEPFQLQTLLYAAGAPYNPFSSEPWAIPPGTVFTNLLPIEEVPEYDDAVAMHHQHIHHYQTAHPPIAGGSGEEEPDIAACWPVAAYFAALPPGSIDQGCGSYRVDPDKFEPCCVGAHLAYFFQTEPSWKHYPEAYHDFFAGAEAFAAKLGITRWQLQHLLFAAGAHVDPFSSQPWPIPAHHVFANLMRIETVPDFEQAQAMNDAAIAAWAQQRPPIIAGGSGEEEPPERWSTADQAQRREALHLKHCGHCEETTTRRCHTGARLATVTDAALVAAMGDRPAVVAGGSGEDLVGDAILQMRTLLGAADRWTKNAPARTRAGYSCSPTNPSDDPEAPYSYCLTGAIDAVTNGKPQGTYTMIYNRLFYTLRRLTKAEWSLIGYNDHGATTHADILQLLDAAQRPPIAGGSGEAEPIQHDYRVTVRENFTEDREWVLSATDEQDARDRYSEGEDVDSRTIETHSTSVRSVEHETLYCEGCYAEQHRGGSAERLPIAGGSGEDPVGDAILAVRKLLADPSRWTRGAPYRNREGAACQVQNAHSYCLTGAIYLSSTDPTIRKDVYARLSRAMPKHFGRVSLTAFNDDVGRTHADILALLDAAQRPPIAGGSGEDPSGDRRMAVTLCIQQHGGPWEGDCEPCHAYEEITRSNDPEAVARWLQHLATDDDEIPNLPPIAGGSIEASCIGRSHCVNGQHGHCDAHEHRTRGIDVGCSGGACFCRADDADTQAAYDERLGYWYEEPTLVPIAGGAGPVEVLPFVAPTDSGDEGPVLHHFHVETRELLSTDRTWFVTARSEDAIKQHGEFNWEELVKEDNEELIEKQVHEVEHDDNCPACEESPSRIRWSGTERPPISGGAVGADKLKWEAKGRGGGKEYHAGKYVIFHPYDEEHLKQGRGGILISKKWRVNYGDRHWDRKKHQWVGEEETLGTYATVQEAKRTAQIHADSLVDHQLDLTPIAGGSGEEEPEPMADASHSYTITAFEIIHQTSTLRCTFTNPDEAHLELDNGSLEFLDAQETEIVERSITQMVHSPHCCDADLPILLADADTGALKPRPPIAGGSGELDVEITVQCTFTKTVTVTPDDPTSHDEITRLTDEAFFAAFYDCTDLAKNDIDHEFSDAEYSYDPPLRPIAGGSGEDEPPRRRLTTRERRTNRMRRREAWADSRARKKDEAITTWEQRRQEVPPMGEPIKIGHHSEGRHRKAIKKVDQALAKVHEHDAMLGKHERAASAIARELDRSIYDDDPDAVAQLQARIDALAAQRARMKAVNQWLTKHGGIPRRRVPRGSPDEFYARARDALQRCREAMQLTDEECKRLPDMLLYSETLGYPPYALSNLSGNIRRQVKRKERLEREAGDAAQS